MTDPATTAPRSGSGGALAVVRRAWRAVRDPRYTLVQRLAFGLPLLLVAVAVAGVPGVDWGLRVRHAWLHLFVVGWFLLVSYGLRTAGFREVVRFWVTGFFPVALVTYALTEPVESLIGTGNLQTGFLVPVVEEVVKALPLLLWTTLLRPTHRHGTLSDFWLLGFAIGAGFSFHEDALYGRLVASGFEDGLTGTLFPIFLTGSQFVITHAGWTALAGLGVGVFSLYRRRPWGWMVGLGLLAVPILDHAAVNWRGTGSGLIRTIVADGELGAVLLTLSVIACLAHDAWILKWAGDRDRLFPAPRVHADARALASGTLEERLGSFAWRQRYRRFRNAAFCDLYRVRSTGASAGDRSTVIGQLRSFVATLEGAGGPSGSSPG